MEITEVKKIWDKVKEEIIRTVPATSHPWILPMEAVGYENGIFSVITGQAFAIQIIRKNHYQQILDVFESLGYHLQKFDIIYDEDLSKRLKKEKEKEIKVQKKSEEKALKEAAFDGMAKMQSQSNLNLKYKFENLLSKPWKDSPSAYYWDVLNKQLVKTNEAGVQIGSAKCYGCQCTDFDCTLGIKYDYRTRSVSFIKNGINLGVGFRNVPGGLTPALDIWFESGSVQIVKNAKFQEKTYL